MEWSVAEAKQKLSEVLRACRRGPQLIRNRNKPVAVLVDVDAFREFQACQEKSHRSLGAEFEGLRELCAQEGYVLEIAARQDRPNPFLSDEYD